MDTILESWAIWVVNTAIALTAFRFLGKNRPSEVQPGMATKSDQFSMKSVFLNFKSGEATVFFTMLFALVNFFLFSLSMARWLVDMVPK